MLAVLCSQSSAVRKRTKCGEGSNVSLTGQYFESIAQSLAIIRSQGYAVFEVHFDQVVLAIAISRYFPCQMCPLSKVSTVKMSTVKGVYCQRCSHTAEHHPQPKSAYQLSISSEFMRAA